MNFKNKLFRKKEIYNLIPFFKWRLLYSKRIILYCIRNPSLENCKTPENPYQIKITEASIVNTLLDDDYEIQITTPVSS